MVDYWLPFCLGNRRFGHQQPRVNIDSLFMPSAEQQLPLNVAWSRQNFSLELTGVRGNWLSICCPGLRIWSGEINFFFRAQRSIQESLVFHTPPPPLGLSATRLSGLLHLVSVVPVTTGRHLVTRATNATQPQPIKACWTVIYKSWSPVRREWTLAGLSTCNFDLLAITVLRLSLLCKNNSNNDGHVFWELCKMH